jgi:hypothetical protein
VTADDQKLFEQVAAWPECPTLQDCSTAKLVEISNTQGLDFATALLYDRVLRCSKNCEFFQRVLASSQAPLAVPTLIGIVPGAFYREHKTTGADGERIIEIGRSLNCAVERIPLRSFGSLSENARQIAEWLEARRGKRIALISLSKGSADLKTALGLPNAAELFDNVVAWMSLSGLVRGTPLVAWLRRQPLRRVGVHLLLWARGQRYSTVEELDHESGMLLAEWPSLPPHLRIIHVLGFPLRRHLAHPFAPRAYERLAPLGPNDGGGILLGQMIKIPGIIFPVWGADHYLQPASDATSLLRQVFVSAMTSEDAERHATRCAIQPSAPPAIKSSA